MNSVGGRQLVTIALLTGLLTSCSADDGPEDGAAAAAVAFYTHLAADEPTAACSLLSSSTRTELESSAEAPCEQAVVEEDLPAPGGMRSASRFGAMAQVRFAHDVVFLSRYGDGWHVVAAGCGLATSPAGTYDCAVTGV